MTGMVFGSTELPLVPWHAAQGCALASMSSAACAGPTASAKPMPAAMIAEKNRVSMTTSPPSRVGKVWQDATTVFIRRGHARQTDVDPDRHGNRDGLSARHRR